MVLGKSFFVNPSDALAIIAGIFVKMVLPVITRQSQHSVYSVLFTGPLCFCKVNANIWRAGFGCQRKEYTFV